MLIMKPMLIYKYDKKMIKEQQEFYELMNKDADIMQQEFIEGHDRKEKMKKAKKSANQ